MASHTFVPGGWGREMKFPGPELDPSGITQEVVKMLCELLQLTWPRVQQGTTPASAEGQTLKSAFPSLIAFGPVPQLCAVPCDII